jgi:hypothetical protein
MKSFARLGWTIPAAALLALPLACGGGGGGDGETTVAASSTQVGQAVLVAASAIDAADAAIDTGGSAVASSSVHSSAMGGGMLSGSASFAGMGMGPGHLDVGASSCDGSGTVATHMEWSDLNPDTLCVGGLDATFTLDDCASDAGDTMHGQMGMTFTGSTCDPQQIGMDFSGVTVDTPEGMLSGDFAMTMSGMMFAGDPTAFDINGATITFDGRMQMAGAGFGTVSMDMDQLAYRFDDATHTADVNGTLTVHCNDQAFPMTMVTDASGLTLDADGNVVAGHMMVTTDGTSHTVTFNGDGSIDVTPTGGAPVHMTEPAASDFCDL